MNNHRVKGEVTYPGFEDTEQDKFLLIPVYVSRKTI